MIQAALNGGRTRSEHPAIPVTPEQLAADTAAVAAVGAACVHIHVRDARGKESIAALDVARALEAIRAAAPKVPVSISVGAWIVPDPAERLRMIRSWTTLPNEVSVNFHEAGAADLAVLLISRGVAFEAGVLSAAAAENLARSGIASRARRLLIEPLESELEDAQRNLQAILEVIDAAGIHLPRVVHGYGANTWHFLELAADRHWDARIGLEDTLTLPDGSRAADNAALVAAAVRIAKRMASKEKRQ
jgi:uncharacterized protein (DUF849 family)